MGRSGFDKNCTGQGIRGLGWGRDDGMVRGVMPTGFMEISFGAASDPLNHSSAVILGTEISIVGTKISSWKYSAYISAHNSNRE